MTDREDLLRLEYGFWQAAGHGGFYREHFSDDGVCVFGFGVLDKESTIAAIEQAEPWEEVELGDVRLIPLGADARALAYSARARRAAGDWYEARISSVYVRRPQGWVLALHQQTPSG
jgi:hypothetical protein